MDQYVSRGKLISGAPLERSQEVSISSGYRAVRIRDLRAPFSDVSSHYLTSTGGTLDTLVFPLFWQAGQVTSIISLTLDRDNGTTSVATIECVDPSSTAVVNAVNAHALLSAVNEQGYLRISAVEGDVWRIRVNEHIPLAGQASASDLLHGVFDHVFVDVLGSTPDPRSYGLRGAVRSTPSRVDASTTNVSSYIQRHEDRTSTGINRAVNSVATNVESIRDRLGAIRTRHQSFIIPNDVFFANFGDYPVRWHKEGGHVTALVVDGSLLPILLPRIGTPAHRIYQLLNPRGHALVRGKKSVDLLDVHGSPNSVYGSPVRCKSAVCTYTSLIEDAEIGELIPSSLIRVANAEWTIEDEVTLNIPDVIIGKVVRGDEIHVQKGGITSTFLVDTVPRNGRVTVRAALKSQAVDARVGMQIIPVELAGGELTIYAGPLPTVTELVYIELDAPIRIEDLIDIGPISVSLPVATHADDLAPADKPTDIVLNLTDDVTEFLLRSHGPLYRDLTNHIELNLQGLYGRQGLGKSIFGARGNLLTDLDYALHVPPNEAVDKILSNVATANYGAPITYVKNRSFRYSGIIPLSNAVSHYANVFNERKGGTELNSCTFDANAGTLILSGSDSGKFDLSDQGRIVRVTSRVGGTSDLSGAKLFVIVEVLNNSRAKIRPVIGTYSITPTLYPDIGDAIPCVLKFVSPTVADELTEYAALISSTPSISTNSFTNGTSRLRIPSINLGYGGKDHIKILGGGDTNGGEITIEPIANHALNFSSVSVAVKFDGTEPIFLIGGVEYLTESTRGLRVLNDGLFESLVSPLLISGLSLDNDTIANKRPATAFNAFLLKTLPKVSVPKRTDVMQELLDLGQYDIIVKSNREAVNSVESKVVFTFEAGEYVKIGASILPIPNSERLKSLFTGMYTLKSVNVLPNGAVELRAKPRLRVQKEISFIGEQLPGGSSVNKGTYLLGTISFYRVLEETKEVDVGYPVRTLHAQANRVGLDVVAYPESKAGIEVITGQLATGLHIDSTTVGKGIEITSGNAASAYEAGLSSNPNLGVDLFSTPAIEIERELSSPFTYAGFVATIFSLGSEFYPRLADLTGGSGKTAFPDSKLQATEVQDIKTRGLAAALRAVNTLPSGTDYAMLGTTGPLFVDMESMRFRYREPVVLIGTRSDEVDDPMMHGSLSVFNEAGSQEERRSAGRWDTLDAAVQVKGDLYIESGDLVIVPSVINEAYRGDLKYYAFNTPHRGYTGYDTVSGVRSHLVPVSDAGILPTINVPFAPNMMHTNEQRFGTRKVFEPEHEALFSIIESSNIDNDLRRRHVESTYAQSSGVYSGTKYESTFVLSGEGLTIDGSLLQPSSARILGEPRKVSRWGNSEEIPLYSRSNGSEFSALFPVHDTERYAVPSDVGRACRIIISVRSMDTFLNQPIDAGSKDGATTELEYLRTLLFSPAYLTDNAGAPALVEFDGYTLTVSFTGIVQRVEETAVVVHGPILAEVLNLPLGGSQSLWQRVLLVSTLSVKSELFGKRWDLNASAVAADTISITDTGAVARTWAKGDVQLWQNLNGDILDYIADDEIIRITATESGSFFRNDVYFLGDLIATGSTTVNELRAPRISGLNPVTVDPGQIIDNNGVMRQFLYSGTRKESTLLALRHIWDGIRASSNSTGVNASQDNRNLLPINVLPSGDIVEGFRSGGVTLNDTFNVGAVKTEAVRYTPSSASPSVVVQERITGLTGSLLYNGIPYYKSGVGSVSSYVNFDLSSQTTEMHVCTYVDPRLKISHGVREISKHSFNVYSVSPTGGPATSKEKEIVVWASVGADLRDGAAYLHQIAIIDGVAQHMDSTDVLKNYSGTVYRYKYLFGITIRDPSTLEVHDGYLLQGNPIPHQYTVPHIRDGLAPRLYDVGSFSRGDPHIQRSSYNDSWDAALNPTNTGHDESRPVNVLPSPSDLSTATFTSQGVGSHAFFNDVILSAPSSVPNLPLFSDSIFSEKWGLLFEDHLNFNEGSGGLIPDPKTTMYGGHVGFIGEYQVPRNLAIEGFPIGQTNNMYVNTMSTYGPALRDAFSSIAELTPTRYVVKLPKPSSEWVGREFKVAIPNYSTHSGVNPFLGAWSESRKVGSLTDYFFYVYMGYWTTAESGLLDIIGVMQAAKDTYASHLIPQISETGIIGSYSDTLWPHNKFLPASLDRRGNHIIYADWGTSSWKTAVIGTSALTLTNGTFLESVGAGSSTNQMYFKRFGSPTYSIDALNQYSAGDALKPNYPGFVSVDVTSSIETPAYSKPAEEADILVVCNASYISDNTASYPIVEHEVSLVDTVKVAPTQSTRLSYTCVPLDVGITDTTFLVEPSEGIAYRWVRI